MSKQEPEPDEQAAAEALARALEGEAEGGALPDDALEAAALLRYSQDGGALPAERRAAVLAGLLEDMAVARPQRGAARSWRRWLLPLWGLAGATAVALALLLRLWEAAPQPGETRLPRPSAALLQAELSSARVGAAEAEGLAVEMRLYRHQLYDALSAHYREGTP